MYDISPTVLCLAADTSGSEISPSIDCHKCPLTSSGAAVRLRGAAWIPVTIKSAGSMSLA